MPDYLTVKVDGTEVREPYGNLAPNAQLEVDIKNSYTGKSRDVYLSMVPFGDFKPAYDDLISSIGSEVILGDLPHISMIASKTRIETPENYLIDMFFPHSETMIDTVRLSTHDTLLPSELTREEIQLLIIMSCHLTPSKAGTIKGKVFHNPRYQHNWKTVSLVGLEIDGFMMGTNPGFENFALEYTGPQGELGYAEVIPKLAEHLQRKV
ncbi:MAG: hypothetical protein HYX24_05555 [Candidatus Aenigmarchaeota archaeon]|nr:hypothetical protein [Candidatus Aenigmarchaeota archaeon]